MISDDVTKSVAQEYLKLWKEAAEKTAHGHLPSDEVLSRTPPFAPPEEIERIAKEKEAARMERIRKHRSGELVIPGFTRKSLETLAAEGNVHAKNELERLDALAKEGRVHPDYYKQ
jgi:hypothetical protein